MANNVKGSAATLRREAAKAKLLAHNTATESEREHLIAMAAMLEREAHAIEVELDRRR